MRIYVVRTCILGWTLCYVMYMYNYYTSTYEVRTRVSFEGQKFQPHIMQDPPLSKNSSIFWLYVNWRKAGRERWACLREGAGQGVQTDHLLPLYRPIRNGLKISLHLFFPFFFPYLSGIWRKIKDTKKGMRECCCEQKGGGQKGGAGEGKIESFFCQKEVYWRLWENSL